MMPSPFVVDASTSEATEELSFATGFDEDVYLRALDFQPGAPNIVRSATITIRFEGKEQLIATWIPGQSPESLSNGLARRVPAGAVVGLKLHYAKTWLDEGTDVEDRSALALYLHDGNPVHELETVAVTPSSTHVVATNAELIAVLARVDGDIEAVLAEVVRPDGSREPILRLDHPSPDWPRKYWLETPLALPEGARVEITTTGPKEATAVILIDLSS
jgi:hypothetical protein